MNTKGLAVDIYRNGSDCTNGGVSSTVNRAILIGPGICEIFEPSPKSPALKLVRRNIGGEYLHAEPVEPITPGNVGYMFGGNFIYTSDSRFPSRYPIPVHDRQETAELNDRLSR